MSGWVVDVVELVMILAIIPCNAFPILYACTSRWWEHFMGRSLMLTKISVALALDLTFVFNFVLPNLNFKVEIGLGIGVYGFIACAFWYQLIAYLRLYRRKKRELRAASTAAQTEDGGTHGHLPVRGSEADPTRR